MSKLACVLLAMAALVTFGQGPDARAQPLGVNPSAAPSDIGNPSSLNPAAAPSDIRNPSAINPAAAASQSSRPGASGPTRSTLVPSLTARPRVVQPDRRARATSRAQGVQGAAAPLEQLPERAERRAAAAPAPSCAAGQVSIASWEALRAHLATCWSVPEGTEGSSTMLRFMINSAGVLRGPPMITATNVAPQEMSPKYRAAALAVLDQCLPICPTADFGAILHDTVLHLRLVNDAPFPSRNLGPWMTIFARPRQ